MNLIVLTPEKEVYEGTITSVVVPGTNGQFEILKNHAPLVSSLVEGPVKILASDGTRKSFTINKGFIEVLNNEVSLLVQGYQEN